jgi:hypothetical protein
MIASLLPPGGVAANCYSSSDPEHFSKQKNPLFPRSRLGTAFVPLRGELKVNPENYFRPIARHVPNSVAIRPRSWLAICT